MKKNILQFYPIVIVAFLVFACIEPYAPPNVKTDQNLLVVDALLNGTTGEANVILSRSIPLSETISQRPELGAFVSIETQLGNTFFLNDNSNSGQYSKTGISFLPNDQYRLVITTQDGKQYQSDYVELRQTPLIDSVTWQPVDDGVDILINTHDAENQTKNYRWEYLETWEYVSAFQSDYVFNGDQVIVRTDNIYNCYQNFIARNILVKSTSKLSEDIVSEFPITFIPKQSDRLLIKYSILVKQYAITNDAFDFWELLKKNTESLGGLFDPLPTQLTGNLQCVSNPEEIVLGYFSASTVSESRIFIKRKDLPESHRFTKTFFDCAFDSVYFADLPSFNRTSYELISTFAQLPQGYTYSRKSCVDCRTGSGTNQKPLFW